MISTFLLILDFVTTLISAYFIRNLIRQFSFLRDREIRKLCDRFFTSKYAVIQRVNPRDCRDSDFRRFQITGLNSTIN